VLYLFRDCVFVPATTLAAADTVDSVAGVAAAGVSVVSEIFSVLKLGTVRGGEPPGCY
jgi:hypothetical protein